MWEFFIRHNKFSYLFLVALIGLGLYSVANISRESSPEVIIPVGVVTTVLPGAPAADVETLITNELERGLANLENVKDITSTSRESVSSIVVEFEASADIDESITDLKDEVDKLKTSLPSNAEDPSVTEVNFVDQPVMNVSLSGDLTDSEFSTLADELENELESIPGVSRVTFRGVREREITVLVGQEALNRYGLSIQEVTSAISSANQTFPVGQIETDGVSYNVDFEGDLNDSNDILNVNIALRGGQPILVRDVAQVVDGLAPAGSLSRLSINNEPSQRSISLQVYKQSGGDITSVTKSVNERIADLKQPNQLLEGVESYTAFDMGNDIETDLIRLGTSGLQTVFLVILLLVVAIGWREGLLAGSAIPLSFLFGFIGLYFSGNTINFLSLFSLILGIGILVDSAIVMVEGINRKMKDHPTIDKKEASISTIKDFSAPLISGTMTTVSMFVGLFVVSGIIGQFIASIPFTLIFLLFASMFVSLAIIPLLASSFLHRRNANKIEEKQIEYAHKLESWYRSKMDKIIGNPKAEKKFMMSIRLALVAAILLPVIGVVQVIFFEQSDVDYLIVEIENPEGTTKEITDIDVRRVEEVLYKVNEIESFTVTVGSGSEFGNGGTGEKLANIFINLSLEREKTSTELADELRQELAHIRDVKITVNQPSDGPPTGAAIVVKFLGDDLTEITRAANEAAEIAKSVDGVINVETSTNSNNTEFVLELDKAKTAAAGLNPSTVSLLARSAVFGSDATSITTLTDDIDVVVKLKVDPTAAATTDTTNVATIEDLTRIEIPTQNGTVLLSDLVNVSLRESSSVIEHEDKKRIVSLTADVSSDTNAREAQAAVLKKINEELQLGNDIELSTGGGETEESNQAFIEMFLALIVGIALMIGVLVLQFNSYLHTRYVISILPYSLIGILVGLAVTGNPLSFPAIMGFIALSGIVVNNSILLIDMMNHIHKDNPEKELREIVLDASASRLRPILLTTATTVIGMIPLAYAGDLWAPLAYSVMFGLLFSVVITLIMIPIIYNRNPGLVKDVI